MWEMSGNLVGMECQGYRGYRGILPVHPLHFAVVHSLSVEHLDLCCLTQTCGEREPEQDKTRPICLNVSKLVRKQLDANVGRKL